MPSDLAREVVIEYLRQQQQTRLASLQKNKSPTHRVKTAGEVRFIKDRSGDKNEWAWNNQPPSKREIGVEFQFNPSYLKPLSLCLRSSLMAMGHSISAYDRFTRLKSSDISPDGNLGGKGYIQKISDLRRAFMNVVEALSNITDTIYDELKAPHWHPQIEETSPRERTEVVEIMQDAESIREDPEGWAEEEEKEMDNEREIS